MSDDFDFDAPLDKTLIEKKRLLGIDRRFSALLIMTGTLVVAATRNPWLISGLPPIYLAIWLFTRSDFDLYDVFMKYRKQGDHYLPLAMASQKLNRRPDGFDRDFPCF